MYNTVVTTFCARASTIYESRKYLYNTVHLVSAPPPFMNLARSANTYVQSTLQNTLKLAVNHDTCAKVGTYQKALCIFH